MAETYKILAVESGLGQHMLYIGLENVERYLLVWQSELLVS